jgi:hypothetical protein
LVVIELEIVKSLNDFHNSSHNWPKCIGFEILLMSGGCITSGKEAKKMVDLGVLPWKVGEATAERRTLTTCSTTLHRKK